MSPTNRIATYFSEGASMAKHNGAGRATVARDGKSAAAEGPIQGKAIGALFDRLFKAKFHGLTNQQIGDRFGASDETVSQLRNGKITTDTPLFKAACKLLRIEVGSALDGTEVTIPELGPEQKLQKLMTSPAHKEALFLLDSLFDKVFPNGG